MPYQLIHAGTFVYVFILLEVTIPKRSPTQDCQVVNHNPLSYIETHTASCMDEAASTTTPANDIGCFQSLVFTLFTLENHGISSSWWFGDPVYPCKKNTSKPLFFSQGYPVILIKQNQQTPGQHALLGGSSHDL